MLRQYIVFQRNIYVFVPTGCSRDLSVRWPLSVQPVAAQCWRSLGRKILSILSKTHFFLNTLYINIKAHSAVTKQARPLCSFNQIYITFWINFNVALSMLSVQKSL